MNENSNEVHNSEVDVLIPIYNSVRTLESSLRSIMQQSVKSLRIIVVDDGSNDGSSELLSGIAAEDSRIIVLTQPNSGIVAALNEGLKLCTSALIARHDADDIAFPDRLAKQLHYLSLHPDCVAVGGNVFHIDQNGCRTGTQSHFEGTVYGNLNSIPSKEPYIIHPFLTARRDVLERCGGYRNVLNAEDTDLYWRMQDFGKLFNLDDHLGEYRIHNQSISGASIQAGRIQSVFSQLAAISSMRRNNNVLDLIFDKEFIYQYSTAQGFDAILSLASKNLSSSEFDYLRIASSLKLIDWASFRSMSLETEDLEVFFNSIKYCSLRLSLANKRSIWRRQVRVARWLLSNGEMRSFWKSTPAAMIPIAVALQLKKFKI